MSNVFRSSRSMLFIMSCILAITAAGCCSQGIRDRGRVQSEWATTFRELGIIPTFPPREDFQVGDIYVTNYDPNDSTNDEIIRKKWDDLTAEEKNTRLEFGMQVRLMHLDLNKELSVEYANRLSAPSSGFDPNRLDHVPSIALAASSLEETNGNVKKKEAEIKTEEDKSKTSQDAINTATTELARAKTDQNRAEADLTEAIKRGGELTNFRKAEDETRKVYAAANAAVDAKQQEVDEAVNENKKKLEAELADLKKDLEVADKQLDAASANVGAATDALGTVDSMRTKADTAKTLTRQKENELETVQSTEKARIVAAKAIIDKLNTELTPLKAKVDTAKTSYDKLVADAKELGLGQPTYANRNVYTGEKLDSEFADTNNPDSVTRLRLVAFPDFVTASFTGADAAAMIPIEAANLGIGLSSQQVASVSVKIPSAESYALPIGVLASKVYQGTDMPRKLNTDIVKNLKNYPGFAPDKTGNVFITVVSEVFFARALDIAVNFSNAGGGRMTASLPAITQPTAAEALPATAQPAGAPIGSTDSFQAMINNVQSRVGQTQLVPGGSIQIVSGNSFGMGLRRTFDRPIAIGFRGFTITAKISDLYSDGKTSSSDIIRWGVFYQMKRANR